MTYILAHSAVIGVFNQRVSCRLQTNENNRNNKERKRVALLVKMQTIFVNRRDKKERSNERAETGLKMNGRGRLQQR